MPTRATTILDPVLPMLPMSTDPNVKPPDPEPCAVAPGHPDLGTMVPGEWRWIEPLGWCWCWKEEAPR